MHYRFGKIGKVEVTYPDGETAPRKSFNAVRTQGLRSAKWSLEFKIKAVNYNLYYEADGPEDSDYTLETDKADKIDFIDSCGKSIVGKPIFENFKQFAISAGIPYVEKDATAP